MEKPKKKDIHGTKSQGGTFEEQRFREGYNKAIEDYEKFLPTKQEIHMIVAELVDWSYEETDRVAKAISQRLGLGGRSEKS